MKNKRKTVTEKEIEKFRKFLIRAERSPRTVSKYVSHVRKFMVFLDGRAVSKEMTLAFKEELMACGKYQISSINSTIAALNRFCRCMDWDTLCVKSIKIQRSAFEDEKIEITRKEYELLVQTARENGDEEMAAVMQTLAGVGLRVSELSHICVESLEKGAVEINSKGKVRCILLPSALVRLLEKYAESHRVISGCIFVNKKNHPLDRKYIWRHMKKTARLAGVPESKVFPHNLRHLFAKEFYRQTGDIMRLADILGHSSVNTTRTYIRTTGREHREQMDRMNMIVQENVPEERAERKKENGSLMTADIVSGNAASAVQKTLILPESGFLSDSAAEKMCEIKIRIPLKKMLEMSLSEKKEWDITDIMFHSKFNNL